MQCRIADLRCKEVINIHKRLSQGFVCDVIVDTLTGCVLAIVVRDRVVFWDFLEGGRFRYPLECIRRIVDDIILIDVDGESKEKKEGKSSGCEPWGNI
jgi:sporulation protein YlmC with PRC-barrel domain